jgi:hypothetical protein
MKKNLESKKLANLSENRADVEEFILRISEDWKNQCSAIVGTIDRTETFGSAEERRLLIHGTLTSVTNEMVERMANSLSVSTTIELSRSLHQVVRSVVSEC